MSSRTKIHVIPEKPPTIRTDITYQEIQDELGDKLIPELCNIVAEHAISNDVYSAVFIQNFPLKLIRKWFSENDIYIPDKPERCLIYKAVSKKTQDCDERVLYILDNLFRCDNLHFTVKCARVALIYGNVEIMEWHSINAPSCSFYEADRYLVNNYKGTLGELSEMFSFLSHEQQYGYIGNMKSRISQKYYGNSVGDKHTPYNVIALMQIYYNVDMTETINTWNERLAKRNKAINKRHQAERITGKLRRGRERLRELTRELSQIKDQSSVIKVA